MNKDQLRQAAKLFDCSQDPAAGSPRKIADIPAPCRHPQHDPPSLMVYSPGVYEHVCPGCKRPLRFTVRGVTL